MIAEERTAVPVEWDDLATAAGETQPAVQPTEPGGVSTLGSVVHTTAADNLRGQGANIRHTIIELSQAISALGDHSDDVFGTIKNSSILVSALQDSGDVMRQLNPNLASVTALLADDPNEVADAVSSIDAVVGDVRSFVADNRDPLGTTSDKLASVSTALADSLDDIKQTLHVAPNAMQNFMNIYQPAQATMGGAYAFNNFANPITFLCGAIQAASRLGAEQSAKLCVQYLAPIVKNRQYNFPPMGENPIVGATARPNEVTYSEDWMRPDYVPPPATSPGAAEDNPPLPAEQQTDPADGLTGMMVPGQEVAHETDADEPDAAVLAVAISRQRRLRVARTQLAAAAGNRRAAGRLVHDPGTAARRRQHRAELAGAGRTMSRWAPSPRSSGRAGMRC